MKLAKVSNLPVSVSLPAVKDITSIIKWYKKQSLSLADRFIDNLEFSKTKIAASPLAFMQYDRSLLVRKYTMKTFPYKIYYYYNLEKIEIIAIIHTARSSKYVKGRLK